MIYFKNLLVTVSVFLFCTIFFASACYSTSSSVETKHVKQGQNVSTVIDGFEFVKVSGDCFEMGCGPWAEQCFEDEKPQHNVCIDSYYIGKYEITQKQWQEIMGSNPSYFKKGKSYPVESVSWNDVQSFLRELNAKTGKTYRLPTEAEWEYASRSGGKEEMYSGGNAAADFAWYSNNSNMSIQQSGEKKPNGLGIYDMSGNVWEWCSDWYEKEYYSESVQANPRGPSEGKSRVLRGGSWYYDERNVRTTTRNRLWPDHKNSRVGFRIVLSADRK